MSAQLSIALDAVQAAAAVRRAAPAAFADAVRAARTEHPVKLLAHATGLSASYLGTVSRRGDWVHPGAHRWTPERDGLLRRDWRSTRRAALTVRLNALAGLPLTVRQVGNRAYYLGLRRGQG